MKLRSLTLSLCIFLWSFTVNAQKICFEDFQDKVGKPLQKALDEAKLDKEIDSLYHLSDVALKGLEGCQMPDFEAKTLTGKLLSRKSLKGKIVVMNFWFIGCKPCVAELPALNRLVQHYKAKNVVFIAFGNSGRELTVKKFLPKNKFDYQIVTNSKEYADKFNTPSWPMNMVFDQEGTLKHVSHGGYVDERAKTAIYNKLVPLIDELLSKQ
jgi:thiol-disulfide isomerase/thioredoxin